MKLLFFSGGTGTPKLLEGMSTLINESNIDVVCNTGDDFKWNSLHISPDLDTVLYLFSNKLDLRKYWGRKNETFHALETLESLEEPVWFKVGDRDLGLHVFRSHLLEQGKRLTEITNNVRLKWGIQAGVYPMADQPVTTLIRTLEGQIHFQEYFVKYQTNVEVQDVIFSGSNQADMPKEVSTALDTAHSVIIGPSNPITSIGPILSIPAYHSWFSNRKKKVIAVSPMIGNQAFSGPTGKLMEAMGFAKSPLGLGQRYQGLIDILVLDDADRSFSKEISDYGIEPVFTNISMKDIHEKTNLAKFILDLI
ncbi:MAG: 2-phospho-L-lactate transferase [Methanobacteriota archaeon]|nr:MAG: 2-phospho-L-lactate transferase [Euryarchaeota archaeon]